MDFDLDALPELDADGKPVGQEVDLDALPELDADGKPVGQEVDLNSLPELDADGKPVGQEVDLDALPELDADGKPVGQEVDLNSLPELDADGNPVGQEVDLNSLPELDADGKPVGQEVDLDALPELDADGKPVEPEKMEQGSPTWAAIKGGIGGFFSGLWAGGNAVANRITKALPEVGIGLESAAGHAARFAGKGLKAIGAEKVGAAVESAGEWIVGDAAGAKAWLDAKLPSDAKDWLGYEDWSTKASDWVGNAAAMAVKFAPGGAKIGGEAFLESVFASDGANAFANVHDTAIEKGASEAEASALGAEAALINYFGGKALMRSGGWAAGLKGTGKQFLASGAASSATMAAQGAGNKMVENLAERKPLMEGVAAEAGEGLVEGAMFHVYNAIPGVALGVKASREARRKNEEYIRGVILEHAKTDQGKAQLATYFDGPSLDAAIQERKAGKSVSRRIADEIGLPETMTAEEINSVVDAVSSQRQAWAARVRVGMDDVQAAALAEEVQGVVGEDARLFERTWLKAVEKINDAKELDDPAAREKLVMESAEEARRESDAERREARQQSAYVKTVGGVGAQLRMMEGMKIGSVEDAIEKGLVSRDEGGRLTGGARQAVNIATHGTEALKSAVKDGTIDAATAESLITVSHTELGAATPEERAVLIDGILERANGDAALARRMAEMMYEANGLVLYREQAENAEYLDVIALAEKAMASLALEEPRQARLDEITGCRLTSIEGGVLGCNRFRGMTAEFEESGAENRPLQNTENKGDNAIVDESAEVGAKLVHEKKPVSVAKNGIEYREAKVRLDEQKGKDFSNSRTGISARLSSTGARKLISDAAVAKSVANGFTRRQHNEIAANVGALFEDASLVESRPDKAGDINIKSIKRFITPIEVDGKEAVAWITVKESTEHGHRIYSVEGIKIAALSPSMRRALADRNSADNAASGSSVPNNLPRVNAGEVPGKVLVVKGLGEGQLAKPGNWADGAVLVAELQRVAEKNGAALKWSDEATAIEAAGLLNKVEREGLEKARARLETRAKLFDVLARTALDTGVTFDEASFRKALEETPNGSKYRDNHGNIYGLTSPDGTLHFNPKQLDYNIPIHEYGHLALESMKGVNRRLWERGMELVKGSDYYRSIKEQSETEGHEYSYLKGDEAGICDEALATMIGDRGEKLVEEQGVGAELKAWLKDFWKAFKGAFGLADMTDAQIEKMTLGEFVDAVNAELLRGKEFGTRKQVPLKEKSIKRYDEADGSGSNGVLRWKNDRGRLFYIPVDMERTQPGGRVVLSTDDANITDWIKNRLNGVELRMSKKGKIYVEGRDGFDGELAEIFGRYPKAGQNDGIGEELASVLHNDSLREATPDQLVEMLAKDRANYDRWVKATRDGKTSLEDTRMEEYYSEQAAREEAEARQRWEDSGMDVPEYILSRIEEGEPGIDLDWETMRELAHDEAEAKLAVGRIFTGTAADYANRSRKGGVDDGPSLLKIGTANGVAFGWGLYGSTAKSDAEGFGRNVVEQTFFTNRAPGDESHLIEWRKPLSDENRERILDGLVYRARHNENLKKAIERNLAEEARDYGLDQSKDYVPEEVEGMADDVLREAIERTIDVQTDRGENVYKHLAALLTGKTLGEVNNFRNRTEAYKTASEFLRDECDIDGIKYPAEADGAKAGETHYVSFRDDNIRVDHKWTDGQAKFAAGRAVKPSALGDGKQRYYEVPFDKAVDKIVKNKKPVSDDHVFVSETPKPFADIGFARLPVMMGQGHVISCYFGEGEGVEGKHLHKMKGNLKLLPKALEKPLMIITSESSPSDSVVAILKMKDNTGASVIVPVKMSGVGRVGKDLVDAHIALTMFGKKNAWKSLVANAIEKEASGEVGVFYIDGAESKTILERLGDKAKGLGISGLQSPSETKAHRNPENGRSGLQSPSRSISQGTLHSIADEGSPVKGGIVSQTATRQFKNWFGGSKVVDANGEPLVVYRGAEYDPLAQEPGKGVIKPEAYFTADPEYAKRYAGSEGKVRAYYLNIRHPFDIRDPECQKDFESVYPGVKLARGKSGALDWAEAATVDGEFLKENFGDKYDGIIFDEASDWAPEGNLPKWRGISYVPLDGSAQVKSATDNIGTFDPGNNDIRFAAGRGGQVVGDFVIGTDGTMARRGTPQAAMIGGARVADDAGRGEQTPGTLAASRELSEQPRSRIQELGRVRVTSFPISEIFRMHKELSGNPMPVHVSKRVRGGKVSASSKDGQIYIASDVIGLIDRTDIPPLKEKLGKHGFFRNENEAWAKNHSDFEVRQERERSEAQLGDELRKLADRRASGKELGGQSAERLVYMNEFAKYVMNMPRRRGSLVGDVQTVGDAVRGALNVQLAASGDKRAAQEKKMRDEAKSLLTWSGWRIEDATEADIKNLTDTMFGAWLAIPDEMERLAPTWYDAILETVTTTPSAAKAYRAAADRVYNSPQAYKYVLEEIQKSQSAAVQAMRDKLDAAAKAPITARSLTRRFAEGLVLGYHDQMGLTWMRFNEETNLKLRARKAALAELKRKGATKAELKAAAEEIDLFTGRIHQTKQKLELSRTAMERGIQNESLRYVIQQRLLEDKATKKWGLSEADKSLYLDQLWVVDSQGRSGIRGESARQARLILGDMARRLGAEKWARLEEYGREWFSIRERELLNDPRLERLVGKSVVDYWRSNAHYVTTKRVQSPEEMEAIERIREKMRKDGINGGDDVCGEMFNYLGNGHGGYEMLGEKLWKSRLGGSFADKAESRQATAEKDMKIQQAARVNQYVIDLRDALLMAEVPGVRDMAYGKADVKQGSRYGFITYFDYGEKRTLIVPREIADGFKRDPDTFKWTAQMHRVARAMMIDYNVGYLPVNQMRNSGSIEKNMPGVYESWVKTLTRFTGLPGAAPLVDLFLEHAARKSAKVDRVLDKVFFGITRFGHINPAERAAKFIFDPEGWQKKFWDAEARGDEDAMRGLLEDKDFAMEALRGNMFTTLGNAYGDAVQHEGLLRVGKKIGEVIDRTPVARQVKKGADWLPKQNEFEDVFAKLVAFHHDRATFGKAHNRTVEESGLVVKQNVSIAEGERRGRNTNALQTFFGQFFNMREKGVVRHAKALVERSRETLVKDGMVWSGRFVGTMFATGAIAAFIRWLYGDDDKKAEESPLGGTYRFAKFMQAASQNINDYSRQWHQLVPVWLSPDGYSTITLGARLNDEDSLIAPSADFVARSISARMGLNPPPELGSTVLDTMWRGFAPDLDPSTPLVKTLRDTVYALADNPIDDFTGKPVYNPVLYAVRNESWATRADFATEMAKRVWDDWGMSAIWKFDRYGKESSDYGSASPWLGLALNKIPVVSSASRRFVKIHVREPGSGSGVDAAVSAEDSRRANVRTYLSDELLKKSEKMGGELNRLDPGQYKELLEGWQETYGLSAHDMRLLEKRFLNKWSERENREWVRNKKRNQLLKKATRIGIEESERRMIRGEL